jgi:hypothetical protein
MKVNKQITIPLMGAIILTTFLMSTSYSQEKSRELSQIIIYKGEISDTGIRVSNFTLTEGEEMIVTAKGVDQDGHNVPIWPTWKADKELAIAVVEGRSKTAMVKALKQGTNVSFSAIYLTDGGNKVTKTITGEIKPKFSTTQPTTTETKTIPVNTWHEIARWQGKSIKNTETFHIPSNEWRISWSTKPGEYGDMNFQIIVYSSGGNMVSVAANVIGEDADSSVMRGKGDYYLEIISGQPYIIIVEARY